MEKRNKPSDNLQAIALFGIIFFGFYFVFTSFDSHKQINSDEVDLRVLDNRVDEAVNKSLRSIYSKKQLRDFEVRSNNLDLSTAFKEKAKTPHVKSDTNLDASAELYEEDNSSAEISMSSTSSLENQLRYKLDKEKDVEAQELHERQEYIRQYKENAKRDGWIVELNDNLEVISAKPVGL